MGKLTDQRPGRILRGPGYDTKATPPHVTTGELDPQLSSFDRMAREFMTRHRVPGMALAVTEQGRLVLARGYGYADVSAREQVTPTSLFRIASISKPITAVAIWKLVEEGRLKLDDNVFDILPQDVEQISDFDERQRDITIRHLLQHRGGWDRGISFDGMFQSVRFANQLETPRAR